MTLSNLEIYQSFAIKKMSEAFKSPLYSIRYKYLPLLIKNQIVIDIQSNFTKNISSYDDKILLCVYNKIYPSIKTIKLENTLTLMGLNYSIINKEVTSDFSFINNDISKLAYEKIWKESLDNDFFTIPLDNKRCVQINRDYYQSRLFKRISDLFYYIDFRDNSRIPDTRNEIIDIIISSVFRNFNLSLIST